MRETNASGIFFDFIEFVLMIVLGSFVLFYLVLGNRFVLAQEIAKAAMPISIFAIIFLVKSRINRRKMRKLRKEDKFDEIFADLSTQDKTRDIMAIIITSLVILLLPIFIEHAVYGEDMVQAVGFLVYVLLWHVYIFRKRDHSENMYMNKNDKARDETFIYTLPIVCMIVPLVNINVDVVDILQALASYGMMYLWRAQMYRQAVNK